MCEQKLKDKVAVITGGAQGIGKAIAEKLADEGTKVVIVDVMEDAAKKTADEISRDKKVETLALKTDVSSSQQTEEMVKKTVEKFGRIDIMINNAGITRDNLLIRMSDGEWDKVLAINLKGVFNCSKAAAKIMMKQRGGENREHCIRRRFDGKRRAVKLFGIKRRGNRTNENAGEGVGIKEYKCQCRRTRIYKNGNDG